LQDFSAQHAETLQFLHTKINSNRKQNTTFINFQRRTGYKGHQLTGHPHTAVYITGQRRGVTDKIKRWLKRRAVVEPIIGHAKNDGLLGRNWLQGRGGDRSNALLAAAGFNLRQLLRFLRSIPYFLREFFCALLITLRPPTTLAA
jgi:hypothetical protein